MDQDQRTAVGGVTVRGKGPKRGEVVGERYEIRGRLRNDVYSLGFLAFDQEHEQSVLLRLIRPELLDATVREDVAERLRKSVGCGGSYLPGLLDADQDGPYVFAIEPVPEGASFRDVLDRRIKARRPLEPFELLPLVSHLQAALLALPKDARHGDVRAENVWTDSERLQLTGGFLLPGMPAGSVAAVIQRNSGLRRRIAPELARGEYSPSSDAYGVAAIAYEALTLQPPDADPACQAVTNKEIASALRPLLISNSVGRSKSFGELVEVLARLAGLPLPELEPAPFQNRLNTKRPSSVPELALPTRRAARKTDVSAPHQDIVSMDVSASVLDDDGLPPPPDVSEDDRTQPRASIHEIRDEGLRRRAEAAARAEEKQRKKRQALSATERRTRAAAAGLDPRLVRAALADDEEGSHHMDDLEGHSSSEEALPSLAESVLDAPLKMALGQSDALTSEGVPRDPAVPVAPATEGTQEIGLDELVSDSREDDGNPYPEIDYPDSADVPMDPGVPVEAAAGGTQEIDFDELHDMERAAGGGDPAPPVDLADLAGMAKSLKPKPAPKPVAVPRVLAAARSHSSAPPPGAPFAAPAPTQPAPLTPASHAPAPSVGQPSPGVLPPLTAPPEPVEAAPDSRPHLELAPVTEATTSPGAPKMRRVAKTARMDLPKKRNDQWIIVVALILGTLMIAGGILWAGQRRAAELEEEKQRLQERIQERIERLQQN